MVAGRNQIAFGKRGEEERGLMCEGGNGPSRKAIHDQRALRFVEYELQYRETTRQRRAGRVEVSDKQARDIHTSSNNVPDTRKRSLQNHS